MLELKEKNIQINNLIFYLFLAIYCVSIIILANKINIWEDESYSLHTTSNSFTEVIKLSYDFEGQPPVYFVLLSLWRKINSGIFFARLFSIFFISLSGIFFYKLSRLFSDDNFSKWMVIIFLLNPFTVWAALEIRPYSMALFFSIVLVYYFSRYLIESQKKYLIIFSIFCIISIYTQYFFMLEIVALSFSFFLFKRKDFIKYISFLFVVLILCLPNILFLHQQVEMVQSHKKGYTFLRKILAVLHGPQDFMSAIYILPSNLFTRIGIRVILFIMLIYGYYLAYKKNQLEKNKNYFRLINVLLLSILVLIILFSLTVVATGFTFQSKYFIISMPFLILLFTLFKKFSQNGIKISFTALSIYYICLLFIQYQIPLKNYDYEKVAKYIENKEYKNEAILFYSKGLYLPFSYYYSGKNPLVPLPSLKFDHSYYEDNIKDTESLKKSISGIKKTNTNSYLIVTGIIKDYKYTMDMNSSILETFLKNNYIISLDTSFIGKTSEFTLRVRRLNLMKNRSK